MEMDYAHTTGICYQSIKRRSWSSLVCAKRIYREYVHQTLPFPEDGNIDVPPNQDCPRWLILRTKNRERLLRFNANEHSVIIYLETVWTFHIRWPSPFRPLIRFIHGQYIYIDAQESMHIVRVPAMPNIPGNARFIFMDIQSVEHILLG